MSSALEVISFEVAQLGQNGRRYTQHYGWPDNTPWCALAQSYCFDEVAPGLFTASAAVSGIVAQLQRIDDREAQPGDIVAFNWDNRSDLGWMDHIGLIEWSAIDANYNGNFGTLEGNTGSDSNLTSQFLRRTRNNNAGYFTAFFRPLYDGGSGSTVQPPATETPTGTGNGVMYEVHTQRYGWLGPVNTVSDAVDGYAGWQDQPIDAIRACRMDGKRLAINTHMNGQWLGETVFTSSLNGSNADVDGYAGDIGGGFIDGIKVDGCSIRVACGGGYYGWMINGQTPEGDGYAGSFGKGITKVQMKV